MRPSRKPARAAADAAARAGSGARRAPAAGCRRTRPRPVRADGYPPRSACPPPARGPCASPGRRRSPPEGDADRDADLPEGVVDAGRHTALLLGHHTHRDIGDHRVDQTDARAADQEPGEQGGPGVLGLEVAHQQQARADRDEADAEHQPGRHPGEQRSGHRRHQEAEHCDRQVADTRREGRESEVVLQIQRQVEEEGEQRAGDRERGQLHSGERVPAEQPERQHRLRDAVFDQHEDGEQDGRADEQCHDQCAAPAVGVAPYQCEDEQEQAAAEGRDPGPVDPGRVRVAALCQLEVGDDQGRHADRHVQEEDPLPAERAGERPADQWPDGDGHPDRRP